MRSNINSSIKSSLELAIEVASAVVKGKKIEVSHWTLSGDLTVFSLSGEVFNWVKQFPATGAWVISGEKISTIDTAGLAFLLECIAHAKNTGQNLRLCSLPSAVGPLMNAQGVGDLIREYVEQ